MEPPRVQKTKFSTHTIHDDKLMRELTVYVGKNAQSNWDLIDAAGPLDLWFHLKGHPSAHVIVKMPAETTQEMLNAMTLAHCASLCRGKVTGPVSVIYTEIRNIKKIGAPGSVLAIKTKEIEL